MSEPCDDTLEGVDGTADEAAEPLGADVVLGRSGLQLDGEPARPEASDDAEGNEGEQESWLLCEDM